MDRKLLHPRYWSTWFGIALAWLLTKLPWCWQLAIGKQLGLLMFYVLRSRRKVCCINLELAFPELLPVARKQLVKEHFVSLGYGMVEMFYGWWGDVANIQHLIDVEGQEYLEQALNKEEGVILLSAHFTSLELGGRMLAFRMPDVDFNAVYRTHKNAALDKLVTRLRTKQFGQTISKNNIREMIRCLKKGSTIWYAQDQKYSGKGSLILPFFGIDAATNPGTSRIAKMTKATVIPFFTTRKKAKNSKEEGRYNLHFLPPIADFPSADMMADTMKINQLIETQVRAFPEQYLWTHQRYKTSTHNIYKDYLHQHPESHCK